MNSVQTQTVGLFFPSQKQISRRELEEEEKVAMEKQMRDRKPLLTAVSPGRGEHLIQTKQLLLSTFISCLDRVVV